MALDVFRDWDAVAHHVTARRNVPGHRKRLFHSLDTFKFRAVRLEENKIDPIEPQLGDDAVYRLDVNDYNSAQRAQLTLQHWRPADTPSIAQRRG